MDEHEAPTPSPDAPGTPLPPMPGESQWGAIPQVGSPTPTPATSSSAGRRWWPVLAAVVVAVVAGVVVFSLLRNGSGLPDELAGQARVTDGPMAEVMASFDGMEVMGVTFDVAIYGGELLPSYMVMVMNGDMPGTDPESLLQTLPSGIVSQSGATVDFSQAISEQVDGTEYACVPAASDQAGAGAFGQEMTMCVFQGEGASGLVMSFLGEDLNALMDVTQELYGEL